MKITLLYPPFCPPTVPPHSITYLASYLKTNSPEMQIKCLDLNAKFHRLRFPELYQRLVKARENITPYSEMLEKYSSGAKKVHRENNFRMYGGEKPELFRELLELILEDKPDVVGLSLVYNSQIFFSLALIEELSSRGIKCVAGGPAVSKFVEEKVTVMKDEAELLKFLTGNEKAEKTYALDFSHYPVEDYLSKEMIYPIRSSYGCCHKACAFCTHHDNVPYKEIDLDDIKDTILKNRIKNLFFIDDTIPANRLSELAAMLKPLGVNWWCQTRPTSDLLGNFGELRKGGLTSISFGIESGNQRILDSMGKGTNVGEIKKVLAESHQAGIKNIIFIMFGFPGETEETFYDTMNFLRDNRENIVIVSASIFGLQKGSRVYQNADKFGVFDIKENDTPLGETITYSVKQGLSEIELKKLKESVARELREMNKLPKIFALLKEQSLFF
ncbi:MAG: B12-binding domain-containing radical SAM protein [Thermoplasmata archaeon]|nr:B12-binding domain-containing radical SAM protein [Thermoplasmata archaeon]